MNQLLDFIHGHKPSLLYVAAGFFMVLSGFIDLLDVASEDRGVNLALLLQQWPDMLVFASALMLLLAAGIRLRQPRLAAGIAVLSSIASLPYLLLVTYYSFFAASIFICILPGFYLLVWIPLAFVLATAVSSIMTLFSAHLDMV